MAKKTIDIEFDVTDTVYLVTDAEQLPRLVTGLTVQGTGITYRLACGVGDSWHYGIEISAEKKERVGAGFKKD